MTQVINVDSSFVQKFHAFVGIIWRSLNPFFLEIHPILFRGHFWIILISTFTKKYYKERLLSITIPQMKIDLAVGYEHHLKTTSSWLWMTYGFFDILEKMNFLQRYVLVTVMLVTSLCWWLNDDEHFKMLMTKKVCWWHFPHVGDIPMGHHHHNMPECDVGDRYVMLETWNLPWCQIQ